MMEHTFKAVLALAIIIAAIAMLASTTIVNNAMAEGVAHEKNFGQCKQDKNDQACQSNKDKFTGPG